MSRVIVVDIETTGVTPHRHSIVSIGAVVLDAPETEFYGECRVWEGAIIDFDALRVNGMTVDAVQDPGRQSERSLVTSFLGWVQRHNGTVLAGMNPHFDRAFLSEAARRSLLNSLPFGHRLIDMHTLAWAHLARRQAKPEFLANLGTDKVYVALGLEPEPKPHHALTGARMEARAIRMLLDTP